MFLIKIKIFIKKFSDSYSMNSWYRTHQAGEILIKNNSDYLNFKVIYDITRKHFFTEYIKMKILCYELEFSVYIFFVFIFNCVFRS